MSAVNTNTGTILEALNNKLDRDMENLDTTVQGPDVVIDWQLPTAANNYKWYRKYRSGWVEQGGVFKSTSNTGGTTVTVDFLITMADTHYTQTYCWADSNSNNTNAYVWCCQKTTSSLKFITSLVDCTATEMGWQVSGMAAE